MKIDNQIRYWAQLINESEDDRFVDDDSSIFRINEIGNIDCSKNQLTSLEGAPQKVGGYCDCYGNDELSVEQIEEYREFLKHPKPEQIVNGHFHSLLG